MKYLITWQEGGDTSDFGSFCYYETDDYDIAQFKYEYNLHSENYNAQFWVKRGSEVL